MNVQLKKGVLDLCVLHLLLEEATYGYRIYQQIKEVLSISESTIYPILRKMVHEKLLTTYLEASPEGPPRKYFKITTKGQKAHQALYDEWVQFIENIATLLGKVTP